MRDKKHIDYDDGEVIAKMLRDNAEGKVIDGKKVSLDDIKKAMLEADNGLFGKISGKISTD